MSVWLVWALAAALQLVFRSSALSYALWVLQIFCAMLEAPLELLFSLEYTGSEQWLKRRWMPLLFLPALAIVVLAVLLPGATVGAERLWGLELFQGRELLKWGYFLYTVILILVNLGVLLACLLRARAFWAPILLVCLGRVIPAVAFVLLDAQELPVAPIQVTILFAAPSMLAYFVALYSYGLLRVMPVARDLVISRMPYALIVLDAENRLVDFNLAAQALPGLPPLPGRPGDLLLRLDAQRALGGWWDRISPLVGSQPAAQDVTVYNEGGEQIYRVLSQPLLHASGWRMGQVLLFEDVTQARLAQSQQAQMLWAQRCPGRAQPARHGAARWHLAEPGVSEPAVAVRPGVPGTRANPGCPG